MARTLSMPTARPARHAVLAAALLLGGCDFLAPILEPAKVEPPAAFQYAAGESLWPQADWWNVLGSSELTGLISRAAANNQDLRAAVARIAQAEANARIAGASLFPSVGAGGQATRTTTGSRAGTSGGGSGGTRTRVSYQGDLSAAYQLDLFGQNRSAAAAAAIRVQASRFDRETVAITVTADVARTYLQVLALRDRLRLAREELTNSERVLGILLQQQAAGAISDLEVAQQRSAVAFQRASLPGLEQSERAATLALAVLIGQVPSGFAVRTQSLSEVRLPPVIAGLPSDLLLRRPDIRRAEADLQAGSKDIASAWAQRFPSIQLTASLGTVSAALSGLLGPGSFITQLAAGLVVPIFEGGRLEATQQLQEARYKELVASYAQTVLASFRDVETALSASQLYAQQYELTRVALEEARRAYNLAQVRFTAGNADFLSVLESQRAVISASDALVLADLARYSALIDLYTALGGGFGG